MKLDFTQVIAVPGAGHIIDTVDPASGLTSVYGRTLADVQREQPNAVQMSWRDWRQAAIDRQRATPLTWHAVDRAEYDRMLGVLPPAAWARGAFLVGEPDDHDWDTGMPRFRAYRERGGRYMVASRPMTRAEFHTMLEEG